jgi:hypothetical protein
LTSALVGGEWSASRPGRFTPGERAPGTHWIGGWVGPRTGLDDVERRKFLTLPGLELRPLGRPARSQSLYRLSRGLHTIRPILVSFLLHQHNDNSTSSWLYCPIWILYLFQDSLSSVITSRDSDGLQAGWPGFGKSFFSSPQPPVRLWGPPSLLLNGYRGLFPWGKVAGV